MKGEGLISYDEVTQISKQNSLEFIMSVSMSFLFFAPPPSEAAVLKILGSARLADQGLVCP